MRALTLIVIVIAWQQQAAAVTEYGSYEDVIREYQNQRELNLFEHKVAKEMVLNKNSSPTQLPLSKLPCISGGTLYEGPLKSLINSVFRVFNDAPDPVQKLYGTIDYGKSLSEVNDPLNLISSLGVSFTTTNIWLNHPPTVSSSQYLMLHLNKDTTKPEIQIIGKFSGDNLNGLVDQLKCLARLKSLGFSLVPWNHQDFKDHMDEAHCKSLITTAENTAGFLQELDNLGGLLNFVTEMSQNPNVASWCNPQTSMLAKLQSLKKI